VPFLRLTRDRRGFENTFLMHADRPGERPRLLYWYRTAPGIVLGRAPLDEDAIRTIEEQHPDIEFDWPAILALSEVMTPEDEAPPPRAPQQAKRRRSAPARRDPGAPRRDDRAEVASAAAGEPVDTAEPEELEAEPVPHLGQTIDPEPPPEPHPHSYGLLEELVGREIATRLRARYSEVAARIHEREKDEAVREVWMKRAEPLNPDLWLTPEAILEGVRRADPLFERLRAELLASP
jgi:hypothetical protein